MPLPEPTRSVPAAILSGTLLLVPAVGWPNALMLQDTLKSGLLVTGVLLATLALLWRPPTTALRLHPMLLAPLALMVYALISMGWSSVYLGGYEATRWLIVTLLMWLSQHVFLHADLQRLLTALHVSACITALWTAGQFWFDWSLFPQGPMPASSFINRNFYAEFAVCVLPYSWWLLARLKGPRWLFAMALTLAFNLSTILMTGSRSALIALVLTIPSLLCILVVHRHRLAWYQPGRLRRVFAVLLLGTLVCINLPSNNAQILSETPHATALRRSVARTTDLLLPTPANSESVAIRASLWRTSMRMLQDQPWFGVGAGAWEIQMPRYQDASTAFELDYYAHNEYLQLLSEYGLVCGGLALAVLLAAVLQIGVRSARFTPATMPLSRQPDRIGTWHCLLSLLALAVVSGTGFAWHLASTTGLLALTLGLLAARDTGPDAATPLQVPALGTIPRWRRGAMTVLTLLLLLDLYAFQRGARAEHAILHAVFEAATLPRNTTALDAPALARKTALLDELRRGIALNPHIRKFTPLVAEVLSTQDDWANTAWILRSVVDNHPCVYALWLGLTRAYVHLQQPGLAMDALHHMQQLRPTAPATHSLEIAVLAINGRNDQARALLQAQIDHPDAYLDYELPQVGYALALKLKDQALAVRTLKLRNTYWPEQAADGYFRMGLAYSELAPRNHALALQAFANGLHSVPPAEHDNYLLQVPPPFRQALRP